MECLTSIFILIVVIFLSHGASSAKTVDEYIKSCKHNNTDAAKCWNSSLRGLRQYFVKGYPDYGILPIDPINVPLILGHNRDWSTALVKPVFGGLKNFNILTSINDDQSIVTFNITFPILKMQASYYAEGLFYEFEFDGDGEVNAVLANTSIILELHPNNYLNGGNVSGIFSDVKMGGLKLIVEGLYDGDLIREKALNKAVNNYEPMIYDFYKRVVYLLMRQKLPEYISKLYNMRVDFNTASYM